MVTTDPTSGAADDSPPDPTPDPTPGRPSNPATDPERIRALAHPLRLRLLDLLDAEGDLTATDCARRTGESVASCSFHLHTLARHGFVLPAPRRGREKPWRSVRQRDSRYDPAQPESLRAVSEMARLTVDREAERLHRWLGTAATEDDTWLLSANLQVSSFWATAEELREVAEELGRLTSRFAGRSEDPALRPAGARLSRLFSAVNAEPEA
ncbi:MAG TPA: helix-turn-helix domain-containing protein [Cellulomonas sp.]